MIVHCTRSSHWKVCGWLARICDKTQMSWTMHQCLAPLWGSPASVGKLLRTIFPTNGELELRSLFSSELRLYHISSQGFGIGYHLNGLSGNTNKRYNQFCAQDMIFFNFVNKRMEINNQNASKLDEIWPLFKNRTSFSPSLFELL